MTDNDPELTEHDRQVEIVLRAVAGLFARFGPEGMAPEAIFEGAVKGGAVALLSAGATADQVADFLETMGQSFRALDAPKIRVVK